MTLDDSIQGIRLRALELAKERGSVTEACEQLGISRSLFYRWRKRFESYGADGLHPKRTRAGRGHPLGNGAFYFGFIPEVFCEDAGGAAPSTLEPAPPEPPSSDHPLSASAPGAVPPGPVVPRQETAAAPPAQPALPEQAASTATVSAVADATAATQPTTAKRKVLILQIADGKSRDGDAGAGSGAALAATIRDALVARGMLPLVSECPSMEEGIKEARRLSYESILRVVITEWEDNATAWSGNADPAAISLELFDLTPSLVSSATQRKKGSRWAMSSKSPDQWFPELVKNTVTKVFSPS